MSFREGACHSERSEESHLYRSRALFGLVAPSAGDVGTESCERMNREGFAPSR